MSLSTVHIIGRECILVAMQRQALELQLARCAFVNSVRAICGHCGIRSRRRRRRHYSRHQHTCRTSCVDELVHVRGGTEQHDGTCLYHSILAHDVTPPTWRGLHWFGLTRCRMLLQAVIQLISVHQGAARHCQHRYRTAST